MQTINLIGSITNILMFILALFTFLKDVLYNNRNETVNIYYSFRDYTSIEYPVDTQKKHSKLFIALSVIFGIFTPFINNLMHTLLLLVFLACYFIQYKNIQYFKRKEYPINFFSYLSFILIGGIYLLVIINFYSLFPSVILTNPPIIGLSDIGKGMTESSGVTDKLNGTVSAK